MPETLQDRLGDYIEYASNLNRVADVTFYNQLKDHIDCMETIIKGNDIQVQEFNAEIYELKSQEFGILATASKLKAEKLAVFSLIDSIKSGMNLNYQTIADQLSAIYKEGEE